jgi:hypothetical protein
MPSGKGGVGGAQAAVRAKEFLVLTETKFRAATSVINYKYFWYQSA